MYKVARHIKYLHFFYGEKRIVNGKHVRLNVCHGTALLFIYAWETHSCCFLSHKEAQPPEESEVSRTIIFTLPLCVRKSRRIRFGVKSRRMATQILSNLTIQLCVICLVFFVAISEYPWRLEVFRSEPMPLNSHLLQFSFHVFFASSFSQKLLIT